MLCANVINIKMVCSGLNGARVALIKEKKFQLPVISKVKD